MIMAAKHVGVCIVGAGVAGLAAAQRLLQAGVWDVLLLEAQDRVGGRIHTVHHGSHYLEFGAHWIHGEKENAVYDWASKNGLLDDEKTSLQTGEGNTVYVRHNGELLPQDVVQGVRKVIDSIDRKGQAVDFATYQKPYGQYFLDKFPALNEYGDLGEELLEWYGRLESQNDGTNTWFDSSAKGHLIYTKCDGHISINWADGYHQLLFYLRKDLPLDNVLLNTPVKTIQWGEAIISEASSPCRITTQAGQVIDADHIIFTPSLAILKELGQDMFLPQLPALKLKAIKGLGIGVVDKIFLEFPTKWWGSDCTGFSILHDLSQNQPEMITTENWESGLLGFYECYRHPRIMCAWITGDCAMAMEQVPNDPQVAQRCVQVLRNLLAHRYSIPDAIWCSRSTWGSNPWTRGAYSYRSVMSEDMDVWASDLAQPILDRSAVPRVCFAGEATHDRFYSTVHGAVESGWREADRLTEVFRKGQEDSGSGVNVSSSSVLTSAANQDHGTLHVTSPTLSKLK